VQLVAADLLEAEGNDNRRDDDHEKY